MNINKSDFNVLKDYSFVEEYDYTSCRCNRQKNLTLLAVEKNEKGSALCEIKSADITIGNLFLRLFNRGILKNKYFHLNDICVYLSQYNWKALAEEHEGNDGYKVFANVSELAYKNDFYNQKTNLLKKVAEPRWFEGCRHSHWENKHLKARYYVHMLERNLSNIPNGSCDFKLAIKNKKHQKQNRPLLHRGGTLLASQLINAIDRDKFELFITYHAPYVGRASAFDRRPPGEPEPISYRDMHMAVPKLNPAPKIHQTDRNNEEVKRMMTIANLFTSSIELLHFLMANSPLRPR